MIRKEANRLFFVPRTIPFWFKLGVAAEVTVLVVTFFGWRALNRNEDSRLYLYKNCYPILDKYYTISEKLEKNYKQREIDLERWTADQKI